jgi:hypothetical protein
VNDKDRWPLSQDGEDEYRRTLLARATKGDAQAKKELMETYSVRIYSEKEKAGLYYDNPEAVRVAKRKERKDKSNKQKERSARPSLTHTQTPTSD